MHHNARFTAGRPATVAKRHHWLALLALVAASALGGCQMRDKVRPLSSEAPPPPVFVDATAPAYCRAAEVRYALGKPITQELLQDLVTKTGARMARTVSVEDPEKKDANEERLTVDLDAVGRVVGARCG